MLEGYFCLEGYIQKWIQRNLHLPMEKIVMLMNFLPTFFTYTP